MITGSFEAVMSGYNIYVYSLSELEDLEYRKVVVRGHFDHSNELHVLPRTLVEGSEPDSGDQNVKRRFPDTSRTSGANVVTAFVVDSDQHPKFVKL